MSLGYFPFGEEAHLPPPSKALSGNGAAARAATAPAIPGDVVHGLFDHGTGYKVSRTIFERIERPLDEICQQLSRCGCFSIEIVDDGDRVHVEYSMSALDALEISKGDPGPFWSLHGMKFISSVTRRLEPAHLAEAMARWAKLEKHSPPGLLLMAFRATRILRRYQILELNGLDCGINVQVDIDSEAVQKFFSSPLDIIIALEEAVKWIRSSYKEHRQKTAR